MTTPPLLKTLVLVRHAHRDKAMGREQDNGLSEKGFKQVERLAKFYEETFDTRRAHVLSSPKLRCRQTVEGIARGTDTRVEIDPRLDEQGPDESHSGMLRRLREFHAWWLMEKAPLVVACSHGDWIPEYLREIVNCRADLEKGGWVRIQLEDGKPVLREIIQEPGRD